MVTSKLGYSKSSSGYTDILIKIPTLRPKKNKEKISRVSYSNKRCTSTIEQTLHIKNRTNIAHQQFPGLQLKGINEENIFKVNESKKMSEKFPS